MISRLRQLFHRYAMQHLKAEAFGFALFDENGGQIGHLDRVELAGGLVRAEGWTTATRVALVGKDRRVEAWPGLRRQDVQDGSGAGGDDIGFALEQTFWGTPPSLCLETGGTRHVFALPPPGSVNLRRRKLRLLLPFGLALGQAAPALLRWWLRGDLSARTEIKMALGLDDGPPAAGDLPVRLFADPEAAAARPAAPITLILPVYNAFDLLAEVLERVLRHTDLPWRLILIEDCSSDGRVRPLLRDWAAVREADSPGQVTLIEHAENRGFIHSVNEGLARALEIGDHVVLLNSDAFVPPGWAGRLLRPILTRPDIASVTPMSNDAEIFSVPVICQKSQLTPGLADAVDRVAERLDPEICQATAPTGVGFCMAINIDYLRHEPLLDTGFGRGYGEEVDWCQKVRARGGRHLGLGTLFVEHRGGASFGGDQKAALVAKNGAVISARYPRYDAEVQEFIRKDALAGPRLALALALAAERQAGPLPVFLAHSMGGGAEKYLERRIAGETSAGKAAVVLRVGGPQRWQLELHDATGQVRGRTGDFQLIQSLLAPLKARRIVYSCGVGDPDPVDLPARLLDLRAGPEDRIEVLLHDFFPLSPSYTLLNGKGVFAGVPGADSTDPAHQSRHPKGGRVTLAEWRAAWGALIGTADEVVVFSQDSATHVAAAYPQAKPAVVTRPHEMLAEVPAVTDRPGDTPGARPVIGVLGNIGYQKGAQVLVDLARLLEQDGRAGLAVIGNIDPEYALPASAKLHGSYRIGEIPDLVAHYGITCWLIPSIWPETFSFATREALATGLPVMCFDLGAQAEAVRAHPDGQVIALPPGGDLARAVLEQLPKPAPVTPAAAQPAKAAAPAEIRGDPVKKHPPGAKFSVSISALRARGVEVLRRSTGSNVSLPRHTVIEAPASLKWTEYEFSLALGAFSYQVSGYCFAAEIGRYCSFGEGVQIGRQNHPLTWGSTSPAFYLGDKLFDLGGGFEGAEEYHAYKFRNSGPPTRTKHTRIGNDVWIGHGAYICAGVSIGDGAIVAAHSVVSRDVPPYAVVAGNPAEVKKYRMPEDKIETMQALQWWQYAPWQFAHLDMANLDGFIDGITALQGETAPFQPSTIDLKDWPG